MGASNQCDQALTHQDNNGNFWPFASLMTFAMALGWSAVMRIHFDPIALLHANHSKPKLRLKFGKPTPPASNPPSTASTCPATKLAFEGQKNSSTSAISSSEP